MLITPREMRIRDMRGRCRVKAKRDGWDLEWHRKREWTAPLVRHHLFLASGLVTLQLQTNDRAIPATKSEWLAPVLREIAMAHEFVLLTHQPFWLLLDQTNDP